MVDFVERNSSIVKGLASQYFPNYADREDAIQEARIKFMYVDTSVLEDESAWTWTAVSNLFKDIFRQNSRTAELDQFASIGTGVDDQCPLTVLEQEESGEIVDRKIEDLPEELSLTAMLYYRVGMSYTQIADKLQVPEGTIASRMHTVRRYLAKD
jgi:RNA polymerase sigma-70 factor (ECF subfamily)